ncbi:hypothetical protein [Amycolatopsis thermoflava]
MPWGSLTARTNSLPPFLMPPLRVYLGKHDHPQVFVTDNVEGR